MKDKVITLKKGTRYYIIDETKIDGRLFCLGVELLEESEELTNNYMMFELVYSDDNCSIKKVTDDKIKEKLINLFVDNFKK